MPHLVKERGFIRPREEGDDPLPVLHVLCRTLDDCVHLLVELLDDGDRLVVEHDEAATVAASIVGNAFDTDLVQRERGGFVAAKMVAQHQINFAPTPHFTEYHARKIHIPRQTVKRLLIAFLLFLQPILIGRKHIFKIVSGGLNVINVILIGICHFIEINNILV